MSVGADKIIANIIYQPVAILITHNHFDHVGSLIPLKEKIPDRGLGIVLPKNTITSFATQKFIEILKM